jgi:hypothetical protein
MLLLLLSIGIALPRLLLLLTFILCRWKREPVDSSSFTEAAPRRRSRATGHGRRPSEHFKVSTDESFWRTRRHVVWLSL